MQPYDKAARYGVKQDPPGFYRWLTRRADSPLAFHFWLDARRLARPEEGNLTCDTVACFLLPGHSHPTHALIVEFKAESERATVNQLLAYAVRLWMEPPPGPEMGPLAHVGGAVINFTGPPQPATVDFAFPGLPDCQLRFQITQHTLRDEDAAATLADIRAGRVTPWLLAWIPLMHGGAEPGILEGWKEAALTVPDGRTRSTLGGFALLFAELAGRVGPWKKALEGWDMRTSQIVEEWRNEGRVEGQLETCRENLLALLEERFGQLPESVTRQIQSISDVKRLKALLRQTVHVRALDDLNLS